ncbi:hypothetical protein EV356DRAFT_527751 [Viridothelium virens]|uniref:Lytic polysaccharide monooxygenase n=1 Tax=Viridothelium virens TaxID=1048519 RepID=A0A6A6HQ23_VIRVR|nr:hypothetical protein EV356DRAFT_527751 [Viridothelium virens]
MKPLHQQVLLTLNLLLGPACAWKLQEYHSSGCQGLLQTEGGTVWKKCTNFHLPKDDNMARSIKYTGATPTPSGERWLFDLRVFKGKDCSGEEVFVTGPLAETCIAGPWKSFMVNRYVPALEDAADAGDEMSLPARSPETDQDFAVVQRQDDQASTLPMVAPDNASAADTDILQSDEGDNVTATTVKSIPSTGAHCREGAVSKTWTKAEIESAIWQSEWCKSQNNNPCKDAGATATPYPHVYKENTKDEYWSFPILSTGVPYYISKPGPFRVTYKRASHDQTFLALKKHGGSNDLHSC